MQSERAMSAAEWIAANEAAQAAKSEILGGVVQKNIDELSELRKEQSFFREEQARQGSEWKNGLDGAKEELLGRLKDQDASIHRENVRVYRNVQASMIAELEKQTVLLQTELASVKEELSAIREKVSEQKRVKVNSPLLTAAFLLSLGTLAIEILDFTGILSWLVRLGNAAFFGM
ncbi:MAG: hypothetical protein K5707_07330 [Clostridia bacterium]|nr:hypothetical protein [Clostridia bacterium]